MAAEHEPLCTHLGCTSGIPDPPTALYPGGPKRPASWGGSGPGLAAVDGPPCTAGLDYCCGLCGCQ